MQQPPSPASRGRVAVTQPVPGRRSAPKLSPREQPDLGGLWGTEPRPPHTHPRRASRHPGWDPSRPTSFPELFLQTIAGTWLEGGESSAGAVGATRVLAPTAPRRPTRVVSSDFEDWETTVGEGPSLASQLPSVVTPAGRRWPGAAASLISPGGTDSDARLEAAQDQCGSLSSPTGLPTSSRNRVLGSLWGSPNSSPPPTPTHTPCLVTIPPHSQSLQFQSGQQTDLSLPLSTLTLVFEVGVPVWSPKTE